jgi:predicted CopG family antitoxin
MSPVIRQIVPITVEVITDLHHVLQPNRRFTVAVIFFEPKTIETTESSGRTPAGGLARVSPNACLAMVDAAQRNRGDRLPLTESVSSTSTFYSATAAASTGVVVDDVPNQQSSSIRAIASPLLPVEHSATTIFCLYTLVYNMGTKNVRLDERVYEAVKAHKREDETFSEAIERLIGGPSLLELAGILSDEEAAEVRDVLDDVDETATEDIDELVDRFPDKE